MYLLIENNDSSPITITTLKDGVMTLNAGDRTILIANNNKTEHEYYSALRNFKCKVTLSDNPFIIEKQKVESFDNGYMLTPDNIDDFGEELNEEVVVVEELSAIEHTEEEIIPQVVDDIEELIEAETVATLSKGDLVLKYIVDSESYDKYTAKALIRHLGTECTVRLDTKIYELLVPTINACSLSYEELIKLIDTLVY